MLDDAGLAGAGLDERGRVAEPLAVVDLDDPPASIPRPGGALLLGVATRPLGERARSLLGALDLTLAEGAAARGSGREVIAVADIGEEVRRVRGATARNPQAALVLCRVLRASEGLAVPAALDVESFAYSMLLGGPEFRRWLTARGGRPLPPMAAKPVLIERDGDVLRLTLNRPERRNAYGRQMRDALADALQVALLDPSLSSVVLSGAGPAFCSGGDLAEFGTTPDPVTAHFVRTLAGAGRLVAQLRDKVEARVHGACVGAGVELPAFAGRVVAAPGTTFRLPEIGMGLIPGAGGTVSIPRRVGRWRALYLALSDQPLDDATALAWRLIDSVQLLADGDCLDRPVHAGPDGAPRPLDGYFAHLFVRTPRRCVAPPDEGDRLAGPFAKVQSSAFLSTGLPSLCSGFGSAHVPVGHGQIIMPGPASDTAAQHLMRARYVPGR